MNFILSFFLLFLQKGEGQERVFTEISEIGLIREEISLCLPKESVYSLVRVSRIMYSHFASLQRFYKEMECERKILQAEKLEQFLLSSQSTLLKRREAIVTFMNMKLEDVLYNPTQDANNLIHLTEMYKKLYENGDYFLCQKFCFQGCILGEAGQIIDSLFGKRKGYHIEQEKIYSEWKNMRDKKNSFKIHRKCFQKSQKKEICYHASNVFSNFPFYLLSILNNLTKNGYLATPEKRNLYFNLARLLPLKFSCCYDHYKDIYTDEQREKHSVIIFELLRNLKQAFFLLNIPIKFSSDFSCVEFSFSEEKGEEKRVEGNHIKLNSLGEKIPLIYTLFLIFPEVENIIVDYERRRNNFIKDLVSLVSEKREPAGEKYPSFYEPYMGRGISLLYHFNSLSLFEKKLILKEHSQAQ